MQANAIITLEDVNRALSLPNFDTFSAQMRMAPTPRPMQRAGDIPGAAKLASVLVLLYPGDAGLTFALMQRVEYEGVHSGQISLPGGKHEADETFEQTALRETFEEFGITDPIQILGALAMLYVPPSDFKIYPFVGCLPTRPIFNPDPTEVAGIIEVPLHWLLDDSMKAVEDWLRYEQSFTVPFYRFGGHKVWGATAIMLSELEGRLEMALAARDDLE